MAYTLSWLVEKMVKKVPYLQDRRVMICDLASGDRKVLEMIDHVIRKRVLPATDSWSLKRPEAAVESRVIWTFLMN